MWAYDPGGSTAAGTPSSRGGPDCATRRRWRTPAPPRARRSPRPSPSLDDGDADHRIAGDQRRQLVLGHAFGARGPFGHDEVTDLGRRVPHPDLLVAGKIEAEFGQDRPP